MSRCKNNKFRNNRFTAKLTALTFKSTLSGFRKTAIRLGRSQSDLLTEALKAVVKKYNR